MDFETCFQLGYVIKVHGIKGEVQVYLDVDFPAKYKELESVFVDIDNKLVPFFIERLSLSGNKATIKFEEVDHIEEAESLKNCRLYLPLDKLPALPEDQFYFHDIIGYTIIDEQEGELGEITDVYSLPHQDLLAMKFKEKEVLIPVNNEIIKKANHLSRHLHTNLPEGLLKIYLEE